MVRISAVTLVALFLVACSGSTPEPTPPYNPPPGAPGNCPVATPDGNGGWIVHPECLPTQVP